MRTIISKARSGVVRLDRALHRIERREWHRWFRELSGFTMIPEEAFLENLALASRGGRVAGAVVECGVWRGGMSAGMARVLGPHRDYVMFDSFEGLPPAQSVDGVAALRWQADKDAPSYHDNNTAARTDAERAMRLVGVEPEIHQGWFDDTVPAWASEGRPIAVLRLDGDWYESTMVCLRHLFPLLVPGGVLIVDDYGVWDGCNRAVHRYLADEDRPEPIKRRASGVTFIDKQEIP